MAQTRMKIKSGITIVRTHNVLTTVKNVQSIPTLDTRDYRGLQLKLFKTCSWT